MCASHRLPHLQPELSIRTTSKPSIGERTGLYLHIPFCAQKCPYCDFNTYAGLDDYFQQTVDALCTEMQQWQERMSDRIFTTVFIGGGTPTILNRAQLTQIFTTIRRCFHLSTECEITCEANPGTVDQSKFDTLRSLGANRLSIGVQSFQTAELAFLGRIHNTTDVTAAFVAARNAGFDNINLDFIFGLPEQQPAAWQKTLEAALALEPEHLSLYSLIVEANTPLYHWVATGKVADTDDDLAAELYEMAITILRDAGYRHYEVSNWARNTISPNQANNPVDRAETILACEHNLIYWRNQDYLGIGPGAHSHLRIPYPDSSTDERNRNPYEEFRWGNRKPVPGYVKRIERGESGIAFREEISSRLAMGETMMLGLRLLEEGVNFTQFHARHGTDLRDFFAKEIADLEGWGLILLDEKRVRLSERGIFLGNQVFSYFLPEE